jgi:hypothetical protein
MNRALAVLLLVTISGCAIYDGGKVPKTTLSAYEANGAAKPTLSYSSMAMGGLFSTRALPEGSQSVIEGELLAVLESSGYFERIAKHDDSADVSIDVTLTNSGNPAAMVPAVVTGLSLYTIPSWATDNFNLVAKVTRKDGLEKEYAMADSSTIVQWLPMMFVFPAKNFSVIPEIRKNMYRKVLSDMKDDGFLSGVDETLPGPIPVPLTPPSVHSRP